MANEALFLFEHGVDETANQTLSRFGVLKRNCKYQGVTVTPDQERRILLGGINPQYQQIKTNFQLADTKPTIEKIEQSMRDLGLEFREKKDITSKVEGAAHQAEMEAY